MNTLEFENFFIVYIIKSGWIPVVNIGGHCTQCKHKRFEIVLKKKVYTLILVYIRRLRWLKKPFHRYTIYICNSFRFVNYNKKITCKKKLKMSKNNPKNIIKS